MFISGYQLRRLDRYHVLCSRRSFVLGLDIFCSSNCGKCFTSYPVPSILLDSDITFGLDSMDSVLSLAERTYSFCQNIDLSVSTTFQYSRNKIYAQL
jgi:hypothetical protein